MSRYLNAFQALAHRGEPVGAAALWERLELEPTASPGRSSRRRIPRPKGPLVALVSFFAVVSLGAILLVTGGGQPAALADRFRFVELTDERLLMPTPGGFLAYDDAIRGVVFSKDLVQWQSVDLPPEALTRGDRAVGTEERWYLTGPRAGATWTSTDGVIWEEIPNPPQMADLYLGMAADRGTVLVQVVDPFDEHPPTLWRLAGERWERVEPRGYPEGHPTLVGREDGTGFLLVANSDNGFASWISEDGEEWRRGSPVELSGRVEGRFLLTRGLPVGGGWLAFTAVHHDQTVTTYWHRSSDGLTWEQLPSVPFPDRSVHLVGAEGMVLAVDDSAWASGDGIEWSRVQVFPGRAWAVGAVAVDDTVLVPWLLIDDPTGTAPVTTVVTPPQEPDPDGIALQEEILADGVVTRAEFESAVEGMVECMRERGVDVLDWHVDPDGSFGYTAQHDTPPTDDASSFCEHSYLDMISETLARR